MQTWPGQIDPWPGGPKSYFWQPVIASPVIQQRMMEEPQTTVSALLHQCGVLMVVAGCFCIHPKQNTCGFNRSR